MNIALLSNDRDLLLHINFTFEKNGVTLTQKKFSNLYVSGIVAIGCGIDEYMALNPAFKGNRGVAGVAAGGAVPLLPPPLPPATT